MGRFETTDWSLISQARRGNASLCGGALQQLLEAYLPALRAHLVYDKRIDPDKAGDLVQGFVLKHVLEGNLIHRADREGGRFRTWLLRWLENYVRNESRRHRRERQQESEDDEPRGPAAADRSATAFEVAWARTVLAEALNTMELECRREGHEKRWIVFHRRVLRPCLLGAEATDYGDLAAELGMKKEQTQNALVTAKRQFQRVLRAVIGCYELSEDGTDHELADLQRILAAAPGNAPPLWDDRLQNAPAVNDPAVQTMRSVIQASARQVARLLELDGKAAWARFLATPAADLPLSNADGSASTLGDLLLGDHADLDCLKAVKKFAGQVIEKGAEEPSVEVGLGAYFVAIAAAQTRWGKTITRSKPDVLRLAYEQLLESEWLDARSRKLVQEAHEELV